jgi:DNA (cytosine-5)-methyltransferase 1
MVVVKVLDLFSGIGGFSIGLEKAGFETVAFCEIEEYPRAILKRHWPDVPIYGDIKQLTGEQLRADGIIPDLICGGYPCQPFSVAGQRRGAEDDRHLWPEVHRLVTEIRPSWCIFENVAGHIKLGLDEVLSDLEGEGYAARTYNIPACGVDAPHQRQRVWIVAHTRHRARGGSVEGNIAGNGEWEHAERKRSQSAAQIARPSEASETMAYSNSAHSERGRVSSRIHEKDQITDSNSDRSGRTGTQLWETEPSVGRVVNGVPHQSHRLKSLGNAVVPQIPEIIGRTIMRYERECL